MLFGRRTRPRPSERLRIALWPRRSFRRSFAYYKHRVMRLEASPHAIAAGVAAGAFASCTPFVGFHFILSFVLAWVIGGSMIAALSLPRLLDHVPERSAMLTGGGLMTVAILAGSAGQGFAALAAAWAVIGFAGSLIGTPAGRVITRSSDEESRSTVFTAQFALSHFCWLVAYPLAGVLGRLEEVWIAFAVLAALAAAGTAAAALLWPADDAAVLTHEHPEQEHTHEHVHDAHHQHGHEGWEGPEPHSHPHRHGPLRHAHAFVIDDHHPAWPRG